MPAVATGVLPLHALTSFLLCCFAALRFSLFPTPYPRPSPPSSACKLQLEYDGIEEAILEAEAQVERLEGEAADPTLTSNHKRAATVYSNLKDGHTRVTDLYARWAELDAMRSSG